MDTIFLAVKRHFQISFTATILDVLGVDPPETIKGHVQSPLDGLSMRAEHRWRFQRLLPRKTPVLCHVGLPVDLA